MPLLAILAACVGPEPKPGVEDNNRVIPETGDTSVQDTDSDTDTDVPAEQNVVPTQVEGRWRFAADDLVLEADPALGGRITRFALGGVELLTDASVDGDNWGATFWTSPQSAWSWPPPPAIDTGPYTATLDGATLTLVSAPASVGGDTFVVEKRLTVGRVATVEYTLRNAGDASASVAGWQIARVPADGLTFFPAGGYVNPTTGELPYAEEAGHVWFAETPTADAKVLADGSGGWIGHVANGVLLVHRYPDVRLGDAAPGDAEVEVFANGGGGYREVEVQSAYTTLAPGEALTWTVVWEARAVPADVAVEVGSTALIELVGPAPTRPSGRAPTR